MGGFERLHPHLRHEIVHDLGWRSLRLVQTLTIDAVLDGDNCVVLAPTAGGKTEAALFPVLSQVLTDEPPPVAALYVCPIRALLNNQEERLQGYARMVGLDVFKWHGDVSDSRKERFRQSPAHVLMTTPESLEVMLISTRTDARALFRGLVTVVVDEVHAFAADDRGAHLAAILERLVALCGRDLQRIGLSATVGNPQVIGQWLQGSSERRFRLVDPPRPRVVRDLRIDYREEMSDAASAIASLARRKKSLVFVESRAKAEHVAQALTGSGVEVFIHHSAVSRADRAAAVEQFARGSNTAIVCTSTMELGIDVGDLDQVVQVDAPGSVASFLQRLGRTGRRAGTRANCTCFCLSPESLLQCVAVLRLAESGWVEDVRPAAQAMHVLAHQVMALVLQEGGISRHRLLPWVHAAYPFSGVRDERFHALVDTMVAREILYEADGTLSLGAKGERIYGRKNFFELYAVFTAPPVMRVLHGKSDVGYVQALFVSMHDPSEGPLCFRLAGRAWEVVEIEWGRGVLRVLPAERGRVPTWLGQPGVLSPAICQAMMDVLVRADDEAKWLTRSAALELQDLREGYGGLLEPGTAPLEDTPDGVQWHTFAGGAVNRLLATGLKQETGKHWISGNLSVRCKDIGLAAARDAVHKLADLSWERTAVEAAHGMVRGMISKFQPCLPADAEDRLLAERLLDLPATLRFLAIVKVDGRRAIDRLQGLRPVEGEDRMPVTLELPPPAAGEILTLRNPIRWIDNSAALHAMCEEIQGTDVLGLGVKTDLDFGVLCLIQIATREHNYLVDPFAVADFSPLSPILAGAQPVKVVHDVRLIRCVLAAVGLILDGIFDTIDESMRLRGKEAPGGHRLAAVCERELGVFLDESQQTSNCSRRPLDPDKLRSAALDAEVLLGLYERFARISGAQSHCKYS